MTLKVGLALGEWGTATALRINVSSRHRSNLVPRAEVPPHIQNHGRTKLPGFYRHHTEAVSTTPTRRDKGSQLLLCSSQNVRCLAVSSTAVPFRPKNIGCVSCARCCIVPISSIHTFLAETEQGHLASKETKAYVALSVGSCGLDPGLDSLPTPKVQVPFVYLLSAPERQVPPPQASRLPAMGFPPMGTRTRYGGRQKSHQA